MPEVTRQLFNENVLTWKLFLRQNERVYLTARRNVSWQ